MTRRGRVVVVGLGPAGADLLVAAARDALERIPWRFVRTARHPAVDDLAAAGIDLRPFDDRYETEPDLDAVYRAIVEALVAAAGEHGEVVYAVPGSPTVAERTVALLREAPVDLEVVPGLSFVDLAFDRLGIDPMAGARVVDGHEAAVALAGVTGPVLVAQCDSRLVLSDVKLSLIDDLGPEAAVTVLARLGRPDERVDVVALADLDRSFEPDHLTSVYVDAGPRGVATEMARFYRLVEQLRGPGGCPWDAEQTHHSLTRHLLEEAYEVVDAIERLPAAAPAAPVPDPGAYAALADELGDLLFQVVIHTVLAGEAGAFAMRDVVEGIHDKLVRRHPHVFGTIEADTADEVVANWEQIKRGEQGRESMVDGLAAGLPALLAAPKLLRKAEAVGLDPTRLVAAPSPDLSPAEVDRDAAETAVGEALAALVVAARSRGVDAESALRGWVGRFQDRFRRMERLADARAVELRTADAATVADLWSAAAPPPPVRR